jgi:asparagine synthase (glutamine-hydrolysing)
MRGGFVACLGATSPHLVERSAEQLRWHRGYPETFRSGALTIAARSDADQGPFVESHGGLTRLVHGTGPARLADLQRHANRFCSIEWDGETLHAGRDPMGLAPLFYRQLPDALWLSTEVGPLAMLHPTSPDTDALSALAGFAPIDERTGWRGIHRVVPGGRIAVTTRDFRVVAKAAWDPARLFGRYRGTRDAALAEFRDRLTAATNECYAAGSGILLSGGLDSGAVALAAARRRGPPYLVHVHFESVPETDEQRFATAIAQCAGAPLHTVPGCLTPWDVDAELDMLSIPYNRFPYGIDDAALPHLCAAGADVALDGHDGDGVLGPRGVEWAELLLRLDFARVAMFGRDYGPLRALRGVIADMVPAACRPPRWRRTTYMQDVARYFAGPLRDRILHDDIFRWRWPTSAWRARQLRPLLPRSTVSLEYKELEAARHGIDLRHPFADRALVEFMISLPCAVKSDPGRAKAFMEDALDGVFPQILQERPKSDYQAIVRKRVDTSRCAQRICASALRLPGIDYARFCADAERRLEEIPLFLLVNLARVHAFAQRAA